MCCSLTLLGLGILASPSLPFTSQAQAEPSQQHAVAGQVSPQPKSLIRRPPSPTRPEPSGNSSPGEHESSGTEKPTEPGTTPTDILQLEGISPQETPPKPQRNVGATISPTDKKTDRVESENNQGSSTKDKQNEEEGFLGSVRSVISSALGSLGILDQPQTVESQPSGSSSASPSGSSSSTGSGQLVLPSDQQTSPPIVNQRTKPPSRKWSHRPEIQALVTRDAPPPPPPPPPPAPPISSPSSGRPSPPENWMGYHVLHRATFGGTPDQLNAVAAMTGEEARTWATGFLKRQLELDPNKPWPPNLHDTSPLPAPIPINDSTTDQLLRQDQGDWEFEAGTNNVLAPTLSQLQDYDLIRKFHSNRQLLEKMVYFWDNHFNTDIRSHSQGQYELAENTTYRIQGFGNFLTLLTANAKSPAMMVYLNTTGNRKENPNENYIREMLELHTLGVDENGNPNGYSQNDIVEGAKTFTGWDKTPGNTGGFRFVASRHSPGSKTVLGQAILFDGNGPGEGERVLELAARHPSTAHHLAKKLCEYFVTDTPSQTLVDRIAAVFRASDGNIKKVLIAIFTSPEFNDVSNYLTQVKTPLEFIVGIHRNLGVWSSRDPFRRRLTAVGHSLFNMPVPTGYKELADEWVNTNVLFHEVSFAYETAITGFGATIRFGTDLMTGGSRMYLWLQQLGLTTEDEVLGFLLNLTLDRQVTETEYQVYVNTMREGLSGQPFDTAQPDRELPLDRLLATILSNPRYKYQ